MTEIEAVKFFYDNACWSYDPSRETAEQGRLQSARSLARAEARRKSESAWVTWEQDDIPFDDDVHGPDEYGFIAILWRYNPESDAPEALASLGMVDAEPGHPYRRVVEAELALEVWFE